MLDINQTILTNAASQEERQIAVGRQVELFLNSPEIQTCIAAMRQKWADQILSSQPEESAKRESAYLMVRAIDDLLTEFRNATNAGKSAKVKLERRKQ